MGLPSLSVRRPVTFFMVFLGLVGVGLVAFLGLKMDLYPQLELPTVAIITTYPGVSPEDVESLVTKEIEEAVATVEGLDNLTSQSKEGVSLVMANFTWGTDMDAAERHVREKVDLIKGSLPEDADEPLIFKFDPTLMPIMAIGVFGEKDPVQLRRIAEDEIEPRLERVEGVAAADTSGGEEREIQVQIDLERLTSRNITLGQVLDAIGRENIIIPAGTLTEGGKEFSLRTIGEYQSVEEIANTVITYYNGIPVYVRDVADVVDGFAEKKMVTRINGDPAVVIMIRRAAGANTVEVSDRILSKLREIEDSLEGIKLSVIFDEADPIRESMANLFNTIFLAVFLCAVVVFFFLRTLRSSLTVLVSIPVSLVTTFAVMNLFGVTMNIISMGGLALGVGLFVDNSIVVLESIFRHRERGEPPRQGAVIGASEVSTAIVASTLTTICVFFPILFVPGIAGQLFRDIVLTVVFSLSISLFVALSLVPLLSSRLLKFARKDKSSSGRVENFILRITDIYQKALDF
ncbi:efflux RND transporter permease subunit, partial [Candidatus Aerophobetes bacterium]|nr:efflux RND transporter permease subunit [Candidatus Aerophobetes bacterium]